MNEEEIVSRIKAEYGDAIIDVEGEGCSFEVFIISEGFKDLNALKRQQSILGLFQDELKTGKLHALSVRAKTPQEQAGNSGLVQIQL
jgi:acid stress-induced BolA-like protein IbaG/YrbA